MAARVTEDHSCPQEHPNTPRTHEHAPGTPTGGGGTDSTPPLIHAEPRRTPRVSLLEGRRGAPSRDPSLPPLFPGSRRPSAPPGLGYPVPPRHRLCVPSRHRTYLGGAALPARQRGGRGQEELRGPERSGRCPPDASECPPGPATRAEPARPRLRGAAGRAGGGPRAESPPRPPRRLLCCQAWKNPGCRGWQGGKSRGKRGENCVCVAAWAGTDNARGAATGVLKLLPGLTFGSRLIPWKRISQLCLPVTFPRGSFPYPCPCGCSHRPFCRN